MNYYHMTSLNNLDSISKNGLIPQSGANSKLIGDDKIKTFFSEGFEGAIALYVDFQIVYDKIRTGQVHINLLFMDSVTLLKSLYKLGISF